MTSNFLNNLDRLTLGLAKGSTLALVTYLVIKIIAVAHDGDWGYLASGWGQWYMLEMGIGVIVPIILFTIAIRNNLPGLARFTALLTVIGIVLNRLNTALITLQLEIVPRNTSLAGSYHCHHCLFPLYRDVSFHPLQDADSLHLEKG